MLLRTFAEGADAIFVAGCNLGDCHFLEGNVRAKEEVGRCRQLLTEVGLGPQRLEFFHVPASAGALFAERAREMTERAQKLGPNPLRASLRADYGGKLRRSTPGGSPVPCRKSAGPGNSAGGTGSRPGRGSISQREVPEARVGLARTRRGKLLGRQGKLTGQLVDGSHKPRSWPSGSATAVREVEGLGWSKAFSAGLATHQFNSLPEAASSAGGRSVLRRSVGSDGEQELPGELTAGFPSMIVARRKPLGRN